MDSGEAWQAGGVQYRPTAAELLDTMADLLGQEVMTAVPEHLVHRVRVVENLCRILSRESTLGPGAAEHEVQRLSELLGRSGPVEDLRGELAERLRHSDDPLFDEAAWQALVAITRDDLAIAKPGHDRWEGE
jgi:hypothetical protein